jgi:FkbM family methyltransferase
MSDQPQVAQLLTDAASLMEQGRLTKAERLYRHALEIRPEHAEALIGLGTVYFRQGKNLPALSLFSKARDRQPTSVPLLSSIGAALLELNRNAEALDCYEQVTRLDPTSASGRYNLGKALHVLGRHSEALACYEMALSLDPTIIVASEARFRLQQELRGHSDLSKGIEYFSQLGEDCLLDRFFGFKETGFFVDVGAFDGVHLSNTYAFERRGWEGLCVEAAPFYYAQCTKNRPRSRCCNVACTAVEKGLVEFQFERSGLFSGIAADVKAVTDVYSRAQLPFDGFDTVRVPSATLNRLLAGTDVRIDFVSIDVEGTEIDVLSGFDLARYRPRVLVVEANSAEERQALVEHLAARGYTLARALAWNHFFVANEEDARRLRGIAVSAKLQQTMHPLGPAHNRLGTRPNPVYWPPEK